MSVLCVEPIVASSLWRDVPVALFRRTICDGLLVICGHRVDYSVV